MLPSMPRAEAGVSATISNVISAAARIGNLVILGLRICTVPIQTRHKRAAFRTNTDFMKPMEMAIR
jgi:hypothetical protein